MSNLHISKENNFIVKQYNHHLDINIFDNQDDYHNSIIDNLPSGLNYPIIRHYLYENGEISFDGNLLTVTLEQKVGLILNYQNFTSLKAVDNFLNEYENLLPKEEIKSLESIYFFPKIFNIKREVPIFDKKIIRLNIEPEIINFITTIPFKINYL
jgi:hypothetical protein